MRGSMAQQSSRRDFLRLSAAAGVGLATGAAASAQQAAKVKGPVAIVGGGIAGLTAAYRLSKAGVDVHLYEVLERFGGRMWTKRDFTKDGMFCELGGELVDTPHEDLIKLCEELSLPLQSLKDGDAGREFFHFGGKIYNEDDAKKAFEPLAERISKEASWMRRRRTTRTRAMPWTPSAWQTT
jgi:monoamine oxidase